LKSDTFAVALVYATSHAIKLERLLNGAGIATKLIPVPRHLSSDCGVCVRFNISSLDQVRAIVSDKKIELQGIYPLEQRNTA
jgi:hypothetical protein